MDFFLFIILLILSLAIVYWGLNYYRKMNFQKTKEKATELNPNANMRDIDQAKDDAYLDVRSTTILPFGTRRI